MPKKAENPFKMGYDPELDTSQELDPDAASYYLTIIGILRWIFELGRIDIITEVSLLSSNMHSLERDTWKQQCMLWPKIQLQIGV